MTNKTWHAMSVAIAAAWFIVTGQISADDWLTYRHDPTRSGVSSESLDFSRLQQAWSWQSPHPPASAWSGPAKWDAYAGIRGLQSMRNYDPVFSVIATADAVYFGSSVDDTVRRSGRTRQAARYESHQPLPTANCILVRMMATLIASPRNRESLSGESHPVRLLHRRQQKRLARS